MPVSRLATAAAVASAAGLFSGTLLAQNNAQTVEELVVSVRKTDENIQEVPVQVTSLSSEVVRSEAIREIGDVARLTPSLQFDQGFWAQDTRVSIRGLFNRAGRPSAAVLIDGIDVSSEAFESSGGSGLLNQRLLDVERIEVARGPQSALYGRAAFAGGLNYITRRPDDELTTTADIRIAEEGRLDLRGTVSGPLIDNVLSAKIIGSHYELDGDYTNPNTGGDLGGGESDGIGVSFEWAPSDSFSAYWNNTYTDDEFAPSAVALVTADTFRVLQNIGASGNLIPDGMPSPINDPASAGCDSGRANPLAPDQAGDACLWTVTGTIDAQEGDIDISPDPLTGRDFEGTRAKTFRSSLILDVDVTDTVAFRSATSVTKSSQSINFDSTQKFTQPAEAFGTQSGNFAFARNFFKFRQFFQEFQVSGTGDMTNWLVGINAFLEDASDLNASRFWYRPFSVFCFAGAPCTFADAAPFNKTIDRDTQSFSVFGLVSRQIAEQWKITLEGRLIRDKVEAGADTADLGADALGDIPNFAYAGRPGFRETVADTNFLPRATIDFTPSDTTLIYASYAQGIKPPTFNTTDFVGTNPSNGLNANAVGREKLETYEIGTKNTLEDGKLLINGAIFYNDYTDQQVRVQFPRPGGGIPTSGAVNAGKVTVWGVEIDSSWMPTERWLINASYAYTDGEFDDFVLADAQASTGAGLSRSEQAKAGNLQADFSGNETPGNPDHAATLLVRYTAPFNDNFEWFAQGSASYQGERWADKSNLVKLDSYTLFNGQFGVTNENLTIALYAENLFDDDTVRYAQEFIDQSQGFQFGTLTYPVGYFAYLPQPRTIGLRLSYRSP
ncbi:MAG: TonB-dependent receptor [Gammaproteobacteria bacterium]|nr:TonB-dependent receptor [Gammaproteobacteria bacterium]